MLRAVLQNKVLLSPLAGDETSNNRFFEDSLTSLVFERLSYLPDSTAWGFLKRACSGLGNFHLAEFGPYEFWPSWTPVEGDGHRVEPDLFIQVELGDPPKLWDIIVEAKRDARSPQTLWQWRRQIRSYFHMRDKGVFDRQADHLLYLAIDGFGSTSFDKIVHDFRECEDEFSSAFTLHFARADWMGFVSAAKYFRDNTESHSAIWTDILQGLDMAGFSERTTFSELAVPSPCLFSKITFSLNSLQKRYL